jgi:hypothetical protein
VFLAKKFGRHEEYLSIQIEDAGDWTDALKYLRGLGHSAVSLGVSSICARLS